MSKQNLSLKRPKNPQTPSRVVYSNYKRMRSLNFDKYLWHSHKFKLKNCSNSICYTHPLNLLLISRPFPRQNVTIWSRHCRTQKHMYSISDVHSLTLNLQSASVRSELIKPYFIHAFAKAKH